MPLPGLRTFVALAAASWLVIAPAQGLLAERSLSLAMAQAVANGALDKCKSLGFRISVTVVNRHGMALVMLRGDGASLHSVEGSDRKAYTAVTFGRPSADFLERLLDDPSYSGAREYSRVLAIGGGLPIKVGDDVVGAVGVSGSPGQDDVCSQAGIDKIAGQLQ